MPDDIVGIVIILMVLGSLLIGIGIAAIGRWLPMNPVIGIRMPSTMKSEASWKAGHRTAAPYLILGGICAFSGVVLAVLVPNLGALLLGLIPTSGIVLCLVVATVTASKSAMRVPFE